MSDDYGTEAEYLAEWDDYDEWAYDDDDGDEDYTPRRRSRISNDQGGDREQPDRWRCLKTGCNPRLDEASAAAHKEETGHRVAKWPVRSAEGKRRARARNRGGYYDKYNIGAKSAFMRGIR